MLPGKRSGKSFLNEFAYRGNVPSVCVRSVLRIIAGFCLIRVGIFFDGLFVFGVTSCG